MPRFLFTDINKKILTTENPFLKTYFIYYLTVKFLSDGGFSDRNTQKILFVALYDVKPTATRRIGTPPLRTHYTAGCPKHREQVGFCQKGRIFLPTRAKNHLLAPLQCPGLCVYPRTWDRNECSEAYPRFSSVIAS